MPVTPGHFTLTAEQRQFKQMLDQHPTLTLFWDFETRDCDLAAFERSLPASASLALSTCSYSMIPNG